VAGDEGGRKNEQSGIGRLRKTRRLRGTTLRAACRKTRKREKKESKIKPLRNSARIVGKKEWWRKERQT